MKHTLHNKTMAKRDGDGGAGNRGKRHYKFCVLAPIILVALWFMFTGFLTLKWDFDSTTLDDLDVLEVEEREKVVRHMWDVYTHTHSNDFRLPRFWLEAFQAAYQHLVSDVPAVRDAAVSEIAKMSLYLLPLQLQSRSVQSIRGSRKIKQADRSMDSTVDRNQ